MTMLLGYENHADHADVVLTGGVWTLPLVNLQSPLLARKARSSGTTTTNTKFNVDLGASRSIRIIAATHTNLTAAALYRVTWYSDAYSTAVGNTGWAAIPGYPDTDPDYIGAGIYHVFATAITARYWSIEFDDTANPDNYVEVGRLMMPETWEPRFNFDIGGNADGVEPNTPRQNSMGGVGFFNRRTPVRYFRAPFSNIPDEDMPAVRRIRKVCNLDKQVVIIPDPDDTDNFNDRCFIGTLKEMAEISLYENRANFGIVVTESVA